MDDKNQLTVQTPFGEVTVSAPQTLEGFLLYRKVQLNLIADALQDIHTEHGADAANRMLGEAIVGAMNDYHQAAVNEIKQPVVIDSDEGHLTFSTDEHQINSPSCLYGERCEVDPVTLDRWQSGQVAYEALQKELKEVQDKAYEARKAKEKK